LDGKENLAGEGGGEFSAFPGQTRDPDAGHVPPVVLMMLALILRGSPLDEFRLHGRARGKAFLTSPSRRDRS